MTENRREKIRTFKDQIKKFNIQILYVIEKGKNNKKVGEIKSLKK